MMIILDRDTKIQPGAIIFTCTRCGCVFAAGKKERTVVTDDRNNPIYFCNCPKCYSNTYYYAF